MVTAKLPKIEIYFYWLVWIVSSCVSIYHVYLASKMFDFGNIGDDFQVSWSEYKKDTVDYEWTTWLPFMLNSLFPFTAVHIACTEVTRWISSKYVPGVHCLVTIIFLTTNFGPGCAIFQITQVVVYYLILRLKSVILVWMFGIPFLLIMCFCWEEIWKYSDSDDRVFTMMVVGTTWLHLRCTSFSLETLWSSQNLSQVDKAQTFYDMLGYTFYLPTYFLGPFIIYSDFGPYMYRPFERWTGKRVRMFLFNMLRYLFWAAVTEGSLYFLYIHALQFHLETVVRLGEWTLYGLGFLLGQFFYMKYIVIYGLMSTVANFDGYKAPPPPKCVARIHLYTDMWRTFDVGFYLFMHKYIYSPLCGGHRHLSRRLLSSAVCFGFVFLWHGLQLSVFVWSLLNFVGISLVAAAKTFSRTPLFINWKGRVLSEANSRRLSAMIAAPLFLLSPVASFYFFSGVNTGNTYMKHLFISGPWGGVLSLLFVAYCVCQVSIETKIWDETKLKKLKPN